MDAILTYVITKDRAGQTVEKILKKELEISSRLLTFLKQNNRIQLNNANCKSIDVCEEGGILTADVSENLTQCPENIPLFKCDIDVLYEDEFILVVNKPGGIASHPCLKNYEDSLAGAVMYHWSASGEYHNYHIVNRLDKDTSGICIIAKNKFAHGVLSAQIKNKTFERRYFAVVHGVPSPLDGTIELPIARQSDSGIKRVISEDGKYAKTLYKTSKTFGDKYSLVEIELETGRTHQIRVHFSQTGHPLVGDWLYGKGDSEKNLIKRQALHAGFVKFLHPANKREMLFSTDLPLDIKNFCHICENAMESKEKVL